MTQNRLVKNLEIGLWVSYSNLCVPFCWSPQQGWHKHRCCALVGAVLVTDRDHIWHFLPTQCTLWVKLSVTPIGSASAEATAVFGLDIDESLLCQLIKCWNRGKEAHKSNFQDIIMLIGLSTNQLMPFLCFYSWSLESFRFTEHQQFSNNRNVVIDRIGHYPNGLSIFLTCSYQFVETGMTQTCKVFLQ